MTYTYTNQREIRRALWGTHEGFTGIRHRRIPDEWDTNDCHREQAEPEE